MNKRKFWWLFTGFFVGIMCLLVMAANPSFQNFLTTEFSVTGSGSGQMIQIKDGAQLPGTLNVGTINITNLNAVTGALTVDKSISLTGGTGPGWTETNTASGSQLNFSNTDFQIIPSSLGTPVFDIFQAGPVTISFLGNGGQSLVYGSGNLTITGGAFTGNGSGLTTLNAGNLSSGTVATARLGSGSATSSTFLRGDQTWATPAGGGIATLNGLGTNTIFRGLAETNDATGGFKSTNGQVFIWGATNSVSEVVSNNYTADSSQLGISWNTTTLGNIGGVSYSGTIHGWGLNFDLSGAALKWNSRCQVLSPLDGVIQIIPNSGVSAGINVGVVATTKTANYTVVTTDAETFFNNSGAGGAVTNTLPAATAGLRYAFTVVTAQNFAAKAVGTDTIRNAASVSSAAGLIFTSTIGNTVHIYCPVAGVWYVDSLVGTWTVQ